MNDRWVWKAFGLFVGVLLLSAPTSASADGVYQLMAWRYGIIAWLAPELVFDSAVIARLEEAVDSAFTFWGFEAPQPAENWQTPQEIPFRASLEEVPQLRLKDPETGDMWRVDPLSWQGTQIPPLLAVISPTMKKQIELFGTGNQAWFGKGTIMDGGDSSNVFSLLSRGSHIVCTAETEMEVFVHELAHWVTHEWLWSQSVSIFEIPSFIIEGIAEYTAASFRSDAARRRRDVRHWAQKNELASSIQDGYMKYAVGESFVTYLCEKQGKREFLASLEAWRRDPERLIADHEAGWRRTRRLDLASWPYWLVLSILVTAVLGSGGMLRWIDHRRDRRRC